MLRYLYWTFLLEILSCNCSGVFWIKSCSIHSKKWNLGCLSPVSVFPSIAFHTVLIETFFSAILKKQWLKILTKNVIKRSQNTSLSASQFPFVRVSGHLLHVLPKRFTYLSVLDQATSFSFCVLLFSVISKLCVDVFSIFFVK